MKEELQGEEDESLTSSLELITLFPAGNTFSYWKASHKDSQDNEFIVAKTVSGNKSNCTEWPKWSWNLVHVANNKICMYFSIDHHSIEQSIVTCQKRWMEYIF